jgi:cytoskeletal protein CcmA (bactofilin family)
LTPEPSAGAPRKAGLSKDVEIEGSIKFRDELTLDCRVRGDIVSKGNLILESDAQIQGNIVTRSVVVHGKVHGNITVNDSCELKASATLIGNLKATTLKLDEGAIFQGHVEVTPNKS